MKNRIRMVTTQQYRQPARYKFALGIAILDVILILVTLINQLPRLQPAFLIPFPQVLLDAASWFTLAEICFCSAILVVLYGLLGVVASRTAFRALVGCGPGLWGLVCSTC